MTNEEAIEQLKHMKVFIGYDAESPMVKEMQSALDLAIKALEQTELNPSYNSIKSELKPSEDCVSRKAIEKLKKYCLSYDTNTTIPKADIFVKIDDIKELSSVTLTRPKARWKILDECANEGVYCSKCHKTVFKLEFSHTMKWRNFKYCPNCGARMEVEK